MRTTYISVDLETTGDLPGLNTLLSIGAAAFTLDGLIGKFEVNLKALPGAVDNPSNMEFWQKWPEAFAKTRVDIVAPEVAIPQFIRWFKTFENPVFVFYPTKFDGLFLYYFLYRFGGLGFIDSPDTIDIKTYAMCMLNEENPKNAGKKDWPKSWKNSKTRHQHIALFDSIEQGEQFLCMLKERLAMKS